MLRRLGSPLRKTLSLGSLLLLAGFAFLAGCAERDQARPDLRVDAGSADSGVADAGPRRTDPQTPNRTLLVTAVFDGDTLRLSAGPDAPRAPDGRTLDGERVRFLGVDAPEIARPPEGADCFGPEADDEARRLLLGRAVTLDYDPNHELRDDFGRLLAYVVLLEDQTVANEHLIRNGYARSYRRFPHRERARYNGLESEAREAGLGLWGACE